MTDGESKAAVSSRRRYNTSLLFVAGLGGLLYGIDIGIIGGALPYLEATSGLNAGQLSVIVAAVTAGQCDLHIVRRFTCRPDRSPADDDH